MDITHVLLSPKGRIGRRDFLRGLILLTGVSLIVHVLMVGVALEATLLHYPILWGYFCVFGKRLHDAGQTAWFNIAFLIGYIVVTSILNAMLVPFLSPQIVPLMTELQKIGTDQGIMAMLTAQQEHAAQIANGTALTTLASFLLASAALAFVGTRLPSDPHSNAHGPATGPRDAA
jgi:uncharacterized membrane protein YhaH (DUF805 family)